MVLLLLALAAVALAGVCRVTLRRAAEASDAAANLQHRWGVTSCRYTLLPDAENVLERAEVATARRVPHVHAIFMLGAEQFDLDLCDEQAKVNVNAVLTWSKDRRTSTATIKDLARATGSRLTPFLRGGGRAPAGPPPKLLPTDAQPGATADDDTVPPGRVPPTFGNLCEVFPDAVYADLDPAAPACLTAALTCWGDGKLNLKRASPAAVALAATGLLDKVQVARLLAYVSQSGDRDVNVATALDLVRAPAANRAALSQRFTGDAFTHSLWIVTRSNRQTWREWAVRDGTNSEDVRLFTGAW